MTMFLAAVALLQVQVRDEPKDWKLISTEHFNIYYPSDALLPRAREFAAWFERARQEHVQTMGVQPSRIHVFLYRSYHDLQQSSFLAAGREAPLQQRIRSPMLREPPPERQCLECRPDSKSRALAIAEPLRNRIFIHCQASDRWNYWFLKHELAHQFQFERLYAFRLPSWLITLKDPIVPQWWWEGGADYWAGIFDSEKDAWVRDLANERLYDLKELHTPDILNPYDYLAIYYEGSYFWRFLDDEYGPGTGRKLFDRTNHGLPIASQKPVQHVVGKDRKAIESDFEANLRQKWAGMMAGRSAPTDRLTDTRAYYRRQTVGGRWSPDGKHLAWVSDEKVVPDLFVDGTGLLGFARSPDGSRLVSIPAWSPDGKQLVVIEQRMNRDRFLLVNVDGGSEAIYVDFDELYDPQYSPDGKKIAFAALKNGTSDIYTMTIEGRKIERITDDPEGDWSPAYAPDGRLAWIKETEGHTVLYVDGKPVTKSWALLRDPQWAPDGKSIVLAADVGGVWDAFSVDPANGKAKRLTQFKGMVTHPAWHPKDGTLVITYFEGRGTDLFRVAPQPQDEPGFDEENRKPWYDQFRKGEPQGKAEEKTRVFGVNWLQFPVASYSLLYPGVEFIMGDRDAENTLGIAAYGTSSRSWTADAVLANTRWRPTIGVAGAVARSSSMLEAASTGFVNLPLLETVEVGAGWTARQRSEYFAEPPNAYVFDSGPTFSALYTNQQGYQPRDPAWGFSLGGSASIFREEFGGDRELDEYFGFFETSTNVIDQDLILWFRARYERLEGREFLSDEPLRVQQFVRGAQSFRALQAEAGTLELRFPIYRDFLWKPLELIGLGEWLILKDLRGFFFGDGAWLTVPGSAFVHSRGWAYSTGAGLRLDLSFMLWPAVNGRVPIRLEGWWAFVDQEDRPTRGAIGGGFTIGY
jgi:TolB protein